MSLQSLLSIARSALFAHQRSMDVTAHNVANANTPGYSRQRLVLAAETPQWGPLFPVGRGVSATAIQRTRDLFYDSSYRRDNGGMNLAGTLKDYLGQIESVMHEPSDSGLASSLDGLFSAFGDLANNPTSKPDRELVKQAGARLAQQLRSLDAQVTRVTQEAVDDMRVQVSEVNQIASQIADLNQRIKAEGGANGIAPDLMDQRDNLLDQLSQYVDVRVLDRPDGTVGVVAGDTLLVDGALHQDLAVGTVGAGWGTISATSGSPVDLGGGSLGALGDLTQVRLPAVRARLDQLAQAMVTEVNSRHRAGYTLGGATNVDFFDPAGVTAGSIQLSAALQSSSDNIAAAAVNAPGDSGVALQLAGLGSVGIASLGGSTMREHYVSLASQVGIDVKNASGDLLAQSTLVDRADQARQSVSGVNIDEEMVSLISQQQAYQAAARLINIADQMMQDVLRIL